MSRAPDPGRLLGTGRNTEVFDLGDGRVLRRHREPDADTGRAQHTVRTLEYAHGHGLPVPRVLDVDGADFVMEKIDGPTMADALGSRALTLGAAIGVLAGLHEHVHAVPPPDWLDAPFGRGDAFLHLDLHPLNVVVSDQGPVLLDWENAARGPAAVDEVVTWLLLRYMRAPGSDGKGLVIRAGQLTFARAYRRRLRSPWSDEDVTAAAAWKLDDPNLLDGERQRLQRLLRRRAGPAAR